MPTLDDALDLAEAGWDILPLVGKIPATAHGVKDASRNHDTIARWWSNRSHNIGARVPSHLMVLDFDPQNGGSIGALEDAAGVELPPTLTVISGRGTGGQHRYFLRPVGPLSSRRLPPGIDVKTDSGYCVVPPSVHPATGRPYTWQATAAAPLPEAVRALLSPPATPPRANRVTSATRGDRLLHLAHFVETRDEGARNAGLFWATCRALEEGHDLELLEGAALVAGLDEIEIARTIASARRTIRA